MLKNQFKSLLLVAMLFSRITVAANVPSVAKETMDITARLNEQELMMIESNDKVVYLTPELVQALNPIQMKDESALKELKELVGLGYVVAPYESTLEAVNHAISLCNEVKNHVSLNALCAYKSMMESGDATLLVDDMGDRKSCRTKKFNRICVGSIVARSIKSNCGNFCTLDVNDVLNVRNINGGLCCGISGATCGTLSACPLLINSDVRICGGLTGATATFRDINAVNETITGVLNVNNINGTACNGAPTSTLLINSNVDVCGSVNPRGGVGIPPCNPDPLLAIPFFRAITTCGNVTFNTFNQLLSAVGSFAETRLAVLREVISFSGSALTFTVPADLGDQITAAGTLPTAAVLSGAGINLGLGAVTFLNTASIRLAQLFTDVSGAIGNLTFQIPVTFPVGLFNAVPASIPAVEVTFSVNDLPVLTSAISGTNALSITDLVVSVSDVTTAGMNLNVTAVALGNGNFADAAGLQASLQTVVNALFNDNLSLNVIVTGTTLPA